MSKQNKPNPFTEMYITAYKIMAAYERLYHGTEIEMQNVLKRHISNREKELRLNDLRKQSADDAAFLESVSIFF